MPRNTSSPGWNFREINFAAIPKLLVMTRELAETMDAKSSSKSEMYCMWLN
jgi:hypothetical protein